MLKQINKQKQNLVHLCLSHLKIIDTNKLWLPKKKKKKKKKNRPFFCFNTTTVCVVNLFPFTKLHCPFFIYFLFLVIDSGGLSCGKIKKEDHVGGNRKNVEPKEHRHRHRHRHTPTANA